MRTSIDKVIPTLTCRAVARVRNRVARRLRPSETTYRQVSFGGVRAVVLANEDVGWRLIVDGDYEADEVAALGAAVRPGDVVFDIGANVGLYSIRLARAGEGVCVVAFEPTPRYQHVVALNADLNGLGNIQVVPCAVGGERGEVEFTVASDGAFSSLKDTGRKSVSGTLKVRMMTLDEAAEEFGAPGVVKIDVEGAEYEVLRGGSGLLSSPRRPRALLVELAQRNMDAYGVKVERVVELMRGYGYRMRPVTSSLTKSAEELWTAAGVNVVFEREDAGG